MERTRVWRNRVNGFQISRVAKLVISDVHIVEKYVFEDRPRNRMSVRL
jgi:hypothetical protein